MSDPVPPLQDLLANPNYGALDAEKKLTAIRNWENAALQSRNQSGDWTLESRAQFEVETRQAKQAAMGLEPQSPETILQTVIDEEADPEMPKLSRVSRRGSRGPSGNPGDRSSPTLPLDA